jgi:hypothetical protein
LCWRIPHLEGNIPAREYFSRNGKSLQQNSRTGT